jgi:hypothetical protein
MAEGARDTFKFIEDRISTSTDFGAVLNLGDASYADCCITSYRLALQGQVGQKSFVSCAWRLGYQEMLREYLMELSRIAGIMPMLSVAGNHEHGSEDHKCGYQEYLARAQALPYLESMSPTPFFWATQIGAVYLIGLFTELAFDNAGFPRMDWLGQSEAELKDVGENVKLDPADLRFNFEQQLRGSFANKGLQVGWLERKLRQAWELKRQGKVAWIVVLAHRSVGFGGYCSLAHWECFDTRACNDMTCSGRHALHQIVERLFFKYEVDVHLSGHTHAYERTFPIYDWNFENKPRSRLAPVYVVAPAGSRLEGPQTIKETFGDEPTPSHVAQRFPPMFWGHLEMNATNKKLRIEFYGRIVNNESPKVLDVVELVADDASIGKRREFIGKSLGGHHETPATFSQKQQCRQVLLKSPSAALRQSVHSEREDLVEECWSGNGAFWRVMLHTHHLQAALQEGNKKWAAMLFFDKVRTAMQNFSKQGDPILPTLLEFGLCLLPACDFTDVAASVALPQMLNRALDLEAGVVVLEEAWFDGLASLATRCSDMLSALRPGFFAARDRLSSAFGNGEGVPQFDLIRV